MEARVSLLTLGVADLGRAVAFYQGLGWPRRLLAAEGVAFFQLGPLALSLFPLAELAEDAGLPPGGGGFGGITLAHNVRTRAEVDGVVARLLSLGGTLAKPAEEKPWGGYGAYVLDPDGHPWEIAWNPGFPIAADGAIEVPA